MATFGDLVSELTGQVPGYSYFLAVRDTNRAYADILRERTWSFVVAEGAYAIPAVVSAGSVSVTFNSAVVVPDPTVAAPALQAIANLTVTNPPINPPLSQVVPLTARQFRLGAAGELYNIVKWTPANVTPPTPATLTLDRPILEPTAANQTYMVYQCYISPPPQAFVAQTGLYDFTRFLSMVDPINGFPIETDTNKRLLDRRDPQRSDTDFAYRLYDYAADALGNPRYELWPHPTAGQTIVCLFKRKGLAFTQLGQPLPSMIPDSLVMDRALYKYAYRWAATNAGRQPALQKVNWGFQQQEVDKQWRYDLQKAKLEDDNVFMQSLLPMLRQRGYWGVIDARFMQSHDVSLMFR